MLTGLLLLMSSRACAQIHRLKRLYREDKEFVWLSDISSTREIEPTVVARF